MTDADIERIAEAVARKLERSQRRAPAGYWSLSDAADRKSSRLNSSH